MGELGLKPRELREITVNEYNLICEGYQVRLQRERDNYRWTMTMYFNGKSKRKIKQTDLMPLNLIDKVEKKEVIPMTAEEKKIISNGFKLPENFKIKR